VSGLLSTADDVVVGVLCGVGGGAQLLRWGRVLQREHYLAGAATRFFVRWALRPTGGSAPSRPDPVRRPDAALLAVPAAVALVVAGFGPAGAAVAALYAIGFPRGLALRGRTSALAWTRRLRVVMVVSAVFAGAVEAACWAGGQPWVGAIAALILAPTLVDIAALVVAPIEGLLAERFVRRARRRLEAIAPRVVAITGSFGKTSTKHHLAELLGDRRGVVPSPRSYNNRAGLSRAINENLSDDTLIFIAEMGTYGRGEIAALCAWCPPEIAIITAIGPVHLERMGSLEVIERAKLEITERARTVILNRDDPRLAAWCVPLADAGKRVRTGSARGSADVVVLNQLERWQISIDGDVVAIAPTVAGVREVNLALAIAAALELGLDVPEILSRLSHLTAVPHRMVVATAPSGVMVIDDTFNANPDGARSALATLVSLPINGRRVVVTPGLVELGRVQATENDALAQAVRDAQVELAIVGRTNAPALRHGFGEPARQFGAREDAVSWVRSELRAGDGVLYLNDLPDHYP
jgi:UDP-N-acetylmuramoyl-tripeptide--D-alanyl-D-alanine ligase